MNEATAAGPAARRVVIDPRIKQRRIEVKRDEGRRRLRYVLAGVAVLSVIGCAIAATRSAMLDVDRVRVSGGAHTSEAEVLKAGGLSHRRFMVSLDPHAMAVRIERLPWIRHASVTRRWPGTVAIELAERRPLAEIPSNDKGFSAVDADGRVLNTSPAADPGLLVVSAGEAPPAPGGAVGPATKAAVEVAAALPDRIRSRVGSIAVVPNGDIELQLRSAPLVRFGPADQIQAKITALTTLFDKANLRGATTIDVRVPGAPILTRSAPSK